MLAGSNLCTLRATASLDNNRNDRLELVLQCGTTTCSPPKFRCDGIHDGLAIGKLIQSYKIIIAPYMHAIECTRKNCGVMKTYNLCEIPNNICVRYEQLQNRGIHNTISFCIMWHSHLCRMPIVYICGERMHACNHYSLQDYQ